MGPEGIILVNPPITTLQQSLTHSAMILIVIVAFKNIGIALKIINIENSSQVFWH